MKIPYDTIENGFMFTSGAMQYENSAMMNKNTGEMIFISDYFDEKLPDDIEDPDIYISIPHKNELGLGRDLVFEFVEVNCEILLDDVYYIFRKKGAYSRFKSLMEEHRLLEKWYDYENTRTKEALINWASEEGIEIE